MGREGCHGFLLKFFLCIFAALGVGENPDFAGKAP